MTTLDLGKLDERLLQFTKQFAKWLDSKTVYGAHVIPVILIPNLIKLDPQNYFLPAAPAVEKIRESVHNEIKMAFGDDDLSIHIKIEEGRPFVKLLRMVKDAQPDLLIFGKKEKSNGSGITAKRVAHNVDTDILLVPENASLDINKILLPIDFSENSYRAFLAAQQLQKAMGLSEQVEALHVVDTSPLGDYEGYRVYDDLNQLLPKRAEQQYEEFLEHYKVKRETLHVNFFKTETKNIASTVLDYAKYNGYNLVIVGAKGHTLLENFMFGSVTEILMQVSSKIPILVVR